MEYRKFSLADKRAALEQRIRANEEEHHRWLTNVQLMEMLKETDSEDYRNAKITLKNIEKVHDGIVKLLDALPEDEEEKEDEVDAPS